MLLVLEQLDHAGVQLVWKASCSSTTSSWGAQLLRKRIASSVGGLPSLWAFPHRWQIVGASVLLAFVLGQRWPPIHCAGGPLALLNGRSPQRADDVGLRSNVVDHGRDLPHCGGWAGGAKPAKPSALSGACESGGEGQRFPALQRSCCVGGRLRLSTIISRSRCSRGAPQGASGGHPAHGLALLGRRGGKQNGAEPHRMTVADGRMMLYSA